MSSAQKTEAPILNTNQTPYPPSYYSPQPPQQAAPYMNPNAYYQNNGSQGINQVPQMPYGGQQVMRNGGNLPQQQDPRYMQQNQPQLQQQYIQQNQIQYQPPQQQMMYQQQPQMMPQYQPNIYNDASYQIEMGTAKDRQPALLKILEKDKSMLSHDDKNWLQKWASLSATTSIGTLGAVTIPFIVILLKGINRNTKVRFLKIGMALQLSLGTTFVYSSYKTATIIQEIDKKYFRTYTLAGLNSYQIGENDTNRLLLKYRLTIY